LPSDGIEFGTFTWKRDLQPRKQYHQLIWLS
jgi:hypothetical protein